MIFGKKNFFSFNDWMEKSQKILPSFRPPRPQPYSEWIPYLICISVVKHPEINEIDINTTPANTTAFSFG